MLCCELSWQIIWRDGYLMTKANSPTYLLYWFVFISSAARSKSSSSGHWIRPGNEKFLVSDLLTGRNIETWVNTKVAQEKNHFRNSIGTVQPRAWGVREGREIISAISVNNQWNFPLFKFFTDERFDCSDKVATLLERKRVEIAINYWIVNEVVQTIANHRCWWR